MKDFPVAPKKRNHQEGMKLVAISDNNFLFDFMVQLSILLTALEAFCSTAMFSSGFTAASFIDRNCNFKMNLTVKISENNSGKRKRYT